MLQQYPVPKVAAKSHTKVLGHEKLTWDNLHRTIDLCAGFGGLSQGAVAAGFEVSVAVDANEKMLELYSQISGAPTIHGDFGDKQVLQKIWSVSKGAKVLTSGFSCQPFSRLGDERSHEDARASCLPKTLAAAFYLQSQVIILECVSPAGQDNFVREELKHFQMCTGFTCSHIDLRLDAVWPCRRQRAWWLLTAPELGPIEMHPWSPLTNVGQVKQVIPSILLWAEEDEKELTLDATELEAFGIDTNDHGRNMLNENGVAPCALHAWGSQLRPCPCGCRQYPLSASRLAAKGLHGCLVRSASREDGHSTIRHIHPNEAMCLNTMDPVLDFQACPRLVLSAVGQIAAPLQALWVFAFVVAKFSMLMGREHHFDPDSQIQAYRSWVLMRSRKVWKPMHENIDDTKLLAMVRFWETQHDWSLEELMYPPRWKGAIPAPLSIAAILDHLIRTQLPEVPVTVPDADLTPTPWYECPAIVDDDTTESCMYCDSCTVIFEGTGDSPIRFQPKCSSTVGDFIHAHQKLVGQLQVDAIKMNGMPIALDHVMEVGQIICITLIAEVDTCSSEKMPVSEKEGVSPTIEWKVDPIEDVPVASPPRKSVKYDVGECLIPHPSQVSEDQWLDAGPLLGLNGEQFLCLKSPTINSPQQLWSVRRQFLKVNDRLGVLERQADFWADDEIRFHLHNLVNCSNEMFPKKGLKAPSLLVLDPLLMTTWIQGKGFDCECWAKEHREVFRDSVSIITVVLVDQHWIPVFMTPVNDILQVHTWDSPTAKHEGLEALTLRLARALGFNDRLICREQRLFFSSTLCGALAITFLKSMIFGSILPTSPEEAAYVHSQMRHQFIQLITPCQITRRPWVWGAGDRSTSQPGLDLQAISVSRDERIDLMNQHGFAMADDEIRFHIIRLVTNQPQRVNWRGTFAFLEPLVFTCWENIGHVIAEKWAESHPHVYDDGQHVVTAVAVDEHWLPLWLAPDGQMLQVHTFNDEYASRERIENILLALARRLGFREMTLHRIPKVVHDDTKCGAYAMAFLAHVITRMPLPLTKQELHTLHTNMRASFVAHLYGVASTPKPVVWGNGPPRVPDTHAVPASGSASSSQGPRESGPLPRLPEDVQRSQHVHMQTRESGPLPIMPDETEPDSSEQQDSADSAPSASCEEKEPSNWCCFGQDKAESMACWPVFSMFCTCPAALPPSEERSHLRQQRLAAVTSHGHAMADDEILFHLEHVLEFHRRIPTSSQEVVRQFVHIPPLTVAHWLAGNLFEIRKWQDEIQLRQHMCHVIFAACLDQHWIPFWLSPKEHALHCHTFHFHDVDTSGIDAALFEMAADLGLDCVIHRVPTPIHETGLCGAMALSFLAHVVLRTPLPQTDQQLRDRSWKMKQKFADTIDHRPPTVPHLWGWKGGWESRPLPIMPDDQGCSPTAIDQSASPGPLFPDIGRVPPALQRTGEAIGSDEMAFHLDQLSAKCRHPVWTEVWNLPTEAAVQKTRDMLSGPALTCIAVLQENHWIPMLISQCGSLTWIFVETSRFSARLQQELSVKVVETPRHTTDTCGANTLYIIATAMGFSPVTSDLVKLHHLLRANFVESKDTNPVWGFGPSGQLLRNLAEELQKHGVPAAVSETRANDAIKALGSEQVATALSHRQPWRQLKALGNNMKFHFLLPSELEDAIKNNKGKAVGGKGKGQSKGKAPNPLSSDLDPHKLQILDGTFMALSHPVPQIQVTQIGPVSSGVVMMSLQEAEPYLKAGQGVSQEPLALAVLKKPGITIATMLPHTEVTIPCRCTLDQEPVLVDAVLVQIGRGHVEKSVGTAVVQIDTLDVVTLKIMVYRDELQGDWEEFCQAPIRHLVSLLPMLKRCHSEKCDCPSWHNPDKLEVRDPILDVWGRQYLRSGFKQCPPPKADIFSVCMRIPQCILEPILASSGNVGAYCEPRTADGKEILTDYTVVWTPKHTLQEMQHLMRTNPAVTGLARLGERRGLRVRAAQAKHLHQQVRPDSVFLP